MRNYMLRRRGLGRRSCNAISQFSTAGIWVVRMDLHEDRVLDNDYMGVISAGDLVFRWGTTSTLPDGVRVVNTAYAIHRVNNKRDFRLALARHRLSPPSWGDLAEVRADTRYPLVVRPSRHAQGVGVHLCHDFS